MSEIYVNSIIAWLDDNIKTTVVERVLWISPDRRTAVMIDVADMEHLPEFKELEEVDQALQVGTARKLDVDPYVKFMAPRQDIVLKHQRVRDHAWETIKDIVEKEPDIYIPKHRNTLINGVCERTGQHKKAVYRLLKRYWVRGKMINALLPNVENCGGPGKERIPKSGKKLGRPRKVAMEDPSLVGVNVTDTDKKMIRIAIKTIYQTRDQNSLAFTYQKMLEEQYNVGVYYKNGVPVPILAPAENVISFTQFRYWAQKELADQWTAKINRIGKRTYNLTERPLVGNSTIRARGPGAIFEIDATSANVYLVSQFDRSRTIGRPVVYIVKDVFSRLVAGLYVGLEGPSWLGAMMALENVVADKTLFCSEYGIEIEEWEWPCHHLPKSITADRGEMEGYNASYLVDSLNIRVDNTPPYRADLKGIVEQHFHIRDQRLGPFEPGRIRQEIRERGEPDYRLLARLTIPAFTKLMILSVLDHNKRELSDYPMDKEMAMDGVAPIPLELWNWGIVNCGSLQERPRDIVRLNLMPRSKASVTRQGIYFEKMHYHCDEAVRQGWYERAVRGRFSIPVSYDPRR